MFSAASAGVASPTAIRTWQIGLAVVLAAGVLLLDLEVSEWYAVGTLYVIPLLLCALAGPPWVAASGAGVTSILVVVGMLREPWSEIPRIIFINRIMSLVVVWTTSAIMMRLRETSRELEKRTHRLADVNYALHQSAIVALTDREGKITFVNDQFCQISQYSREELLGRDHRLINSGYHSKAFISNLWDTIMAGRIWRGEICNRAKNGTLFWVDTTIVPFLDGNQRPYQYMAIRYDITDRKRTEEMLREQAALTRLGQMAAIVAHEVKNPIAGIRGALQVILSRMSTEQRDRAVIVDIIARLDALNAIVGDLLLFARPRQVRREFVDVPALIAATADLIRRDPAVSAVDIQVDGHPTTIYADREMLQIAVQNILLNAAQAMNGRGVIRTQIATGDPGCRITIADQGPGMTVEMREKAFEAFFTTKHRGTGLGLSIARRLVEAHGGRVTIHAHSDGGTVVTIELPQQA